MSSILEESKESRSIKKFKITKKKTIILIIVILTLSAIYFYFNRNITEKIIVQKKEWVVKKDNLKIAIEADGKVIAEDGVDLSFSVSGDNLEIEEIFIKEGDKIKKGDKIATVKTEDLELNVRSLYANYAAILAEYNQILDGATNQEITEMNNRVSSAEISLNQAETDLNELKQDLKDIKSESNDEDVKSAYKDLVDIIKSVNISLDDALNNADQILGIDDEGLNDVFESVLGAKNKAMLGNAKSGYLKSRDSLEDLNSLALSLNIYSSYSEIDRAAEKTFLTLQEFEKLSYNIKVTLDGTITSSNFSQSDLNSLTSMIVSDRISVNTKITSLNTKIENVENSKEKLIDSKTSIERSIKSIESTIEDKKINLEQSKDNYNDLMAPLTDTEKASANSRLTSASVNLEKARNQLDNATIISPIDGEVARLNYKTGDIIVDNSNSEPIAVIINNDTLFIEVNVEEAEINKIKIGQSVYATFDALDDTKFKGEVSFISLTSKTDNSGIVTYLVRIVIADKKDAQIREGMTAFIDFIIAEANNILTVPIGAVSNVNDKPSVLNDKEEWVPVVTGFTDGKNVEIIKGLNNGDKIVY